MILFAYSILIFCAIITDDAHPDPTIPYSLYIH